MIGRVITDSNPEDEREKTVNARMDPDLITNAKSFEEALKHLCAAAPYIDTVTRFDYFVVGGKEIYEDYWK